MHFDTHNNRTQKPAGSAEQWSIGGSIGWREREIFYFLVRQTARKLLSIFVFNHFFRIFQSRGGAPVRTVPMPTAMLAAIRKLRSLHTGANTMSTPVVTDKWAGTLECKSCGRTRLMAEEFSKAALARKDHLVCKQCVADAAARERHTAAANAKSSTETRTCAACKNVLNEAAYNKNQWRKGDGVSRCRECVEKAVQDEAAAVKAAQEKKLEEAKKAVQEAKRLGNSLQILKAESVLAALEGEKVTGLKPVRMSRGGGRGRSGRGGRRGGRR